MSSATTTLELLFPGYDGILPIIKRVPHERIASLHKFQKYAGRRMTNPGAISLERGPVIVGYCQGIYNKSLSHSFDWSDKPVVFDTRINKWVGLTPVAFRMLGPNRLFSLVLARDTVATAVTAF